MQATGLAVGTSLAGVALGFYYRSGRAGTYPIDMPCDTAQYEYSAMMKRGWLFDSVTLFQRDLKFERKFEKEWGHDLAGITTAHMRHTNYWSMRPIEMRKAKFWYFGDGEEHWVPKEQNFEETKDYRDEKQFLSSLFEPCQPPRAQ